MTDLFIKKKIEGWHTVLQTLTEIADSQPQAAYAAFIHSTQHKCFIQRVVPGCGLYLE